MGVGGIATVTNSIVTNNESIRGEPNFLDIIAGTLISQFSLIAVGSDAMLGPLADNGGPTFTHALLPGSIAIDAGDPNASPGNDGIPDYDQRGLPYGRVVDGDGDGVATMDIGAFEVQSPPGPACDLDGFNGCDLEDIDALVAEIAALTNSLPFDLTSDGLVNLDDRDAWLGTGRG